MLEPSTVSRAFVVEIETRLSRDEVRRLVLTRLSVPLGDAGYGIENQNETMIAFAKVYRPYWLPAVLLSWLVFPLLLLLVEETDRVMLTLLEGDDGTSIVAVGEGPRVMRRQFEDLAESSLVEEMVATGGAA
jgi:hypothetical protein